jgi:hypothetical protein
MWKPKALFSSSSLLSWFFALEKSSPMINQLECNKLKVKFRLLLVSPSSVSWLDDDVVSDASVGRRTTICSALISSSYPLPRSLMDSSRASITGFKAPPGCLLFL